MTAPVAPAPLLLRGAAIAASIRAGVAADVESFRETYGHPPALAVVIVGHDAPSTMYLHKILDGCRSVGIEDRPVEIGDDAMPAQVALESPPSTSIRAWPA